MLVNFDSSCSSGSIYPERSERHCSFFFERDGDTHPDASGCCSFFCGGRLLMRVVFSYGFAGAAVDGAGAVLLKSKFTLGAVRAPSSVLK
jgi:hypothetical protein